MLGSEGKGPSAPGSTLEPGGMMEPGQQDHTDAIDALLENGRKEKALGQIQKFQQQAQQFQRRAQECQEVANTMRRSLAGGDGPSRFKPEGAPLSTSMGVPGNSLGTSEVAVSDATLSIPNGLNGSVGHYRDPDDCQSNTDVTQTSQKTAC